uniref:Uncharacterized protein n=1 Tax=Anguilla anguilla TaxID=7936 RepID=A0A0E9RQJ3_ANGAN
MPYSTVKLCYTFTDVLLHSKL